MKLIFKFLDNNKTRKVLKILMIVFLFMYVFSISAFGEQKFKKIPIFNYGIYLVYFSFILLTVITMLSVIAFRIKLRINRVGLIIPAFSLFALLGTIIYSKDLRGWLTLLLLCLTFFVFVYCFRVLKSKYLILILISGALFCFMLFYLAYYADSILDFKGFFSGKNRLGSEFDNQNGVAVFAVVSLGISTYLIAFYKSKFRFFFSAPAFASVWVGITTGSRTFIITSYIILAVIFFFFFSKHKFIYLISLFVATTAIAIIFNSLFENRLWAAIQTLFGGAVKSDTATLSRELYLDYGLLLGARNAIIGLGVNGFGITSGVGTYAHNNYAEVLCDFGIIGLVLFYLPLLIFIVRTFYYKKIDRSFIFTFAIYYFIASFSNVLYYKKLYYVLLAFMFFLSFEEPFLLKTIPIISSLKRVLFTCDTMGSGGAEKVISALSNQMSLLGIKVYILGVADTKVPKSFYKLDQNVKYDNLRIESDKKVPLLKRAFLLRKKINDIKPDVVISFLPNANIYTWVSMIGLNIPHIVSERNNPYIDPKEKMMRFFKKISFNFSNACVFQTNDARDYYSNRVRNKSTIIKNPIILNCEPIDCLLQKNRTILAVGRLVKQKNYKCLLDAFAIFNKSQDNSYLLKIYGDGPLKQELEVYCESIGIKDKVFFAGNDTNWHEKEKNDAMYVLSSDYEGMPNALAEAMALGIPCISTDCPTGGSRELIKDGVNGILVSVNNPKELATKMVELISRRNNFYSETRKMVNDYSPENITKQWLNVIKGLTKEIYE